MPETLLQPHMSEAPSNNSPKDDPDQNLVENSSLYREFLAEREEILRHKWIESEKAGRDIGFERALLDWIVKHRSGWRKNRMSRHFRDSGGVGGGGPQSSSGKSSSGSTA